MAQLTRPAPAVATVAPEVSLLTSARSLPVDVASFEAWRTGLSHRNVSDMVSGVYPAKAPASPSDKTEAQTPTVDDHLPFIIYSHHLCLNPVSEGEIRSEAMAKLNAVTPYHLGAEFWTGASDTDMKSLMSSVATSGAGSALAAKPAINRVLRAFEDATGGIEGMIHVPAEVLWSLTDAGYVQRSGSRLLTPQGHTVVPGPGYPSVGDFGPDGDTAAAGQGFIWMTSIVEVAVGEAFVKGLEPGWDRLNEVEVYAERFAIYRFDTTTVQAGLVTL